MYRLPTGWSCQALCLPEKQTAIIQGPGGTATIDDHASLPAPETHMVLVKTAAVSINPCDWKMPSKFPTPGARIGCDFTGTILAIGPECRRKDLKVGDRICGGIHGSNPIDMPSGSFAQYVAAHGDLLLKLPDSASWEEGAVIGGSVLATLRIALYESLGLKATPDAPLSPKEAVPPVLVYGGSTSTGTMALQVLKLYVGSYTGHTVPPESLLLPQSLRYL